MKKIKRDTTTYMFHGRVHQGIQGKKLTEEGISKDFQETKKCPSRSLQINVLREIIKKKKK